MNKLLIICGPTATGKTSLALKLAQKYPAEIISADSRQVYQGMDIGTGKDIPSDFKFDEIIECYSNNKTKLWGLDLIKPNEEFSVSDFTKFAIPLIKNLWAQKKLPIVVGGTGLYVRSLIKPLSQITIPRNMELRNELNTLNTEELQTKLKTLNPTHYQNMNHSDQNNPRRLIRAIEITSSNSPLLKRGEGELFTDYFNNLNPFLIGLTAPQEELFTRINHRVDERLKQGIVPEVTSLLTKYSWDLPSMSGLGYRQWREFFEQKISQDEVIQIWKKAEHDYAKRQLTWFKKEPGIHWFDITNPESEKLTLAQVAKWYTS